MPLIIDTRAEETLAGICAELRRLRIKRDVSQNLLSTRLPVRGRAVSEWETVRIVPRMSHLILWCDSLGRRLDLVDDAGTSLRQYLPQRPGEEWGHYQRRCLAEPLRLRRQALGIAQAKLGASIGVSRDSIQRWELLDVPPRTIAHVLWAQRLGCTLTLDKRWGGLK